MNLFAGPLNLLNLLGDKVTIAVIAIVLLLWFIRWFLDRTDPNQKKSPGTQ
jgi:hypothetical protein